MVGGDLPACLLSPICETALEPRCCSPSGDEAWQTFVDAKWAGGFIW